MVKQLLNSVIDKYRDLTASRKRTTFPSHRLGKITDLLASE